MSESCTDQCCSVFGRPSDRRLKMTMADGLFPWDVFHLDEEHHREGISLSDMPYYGLCDTRTTANSQRSLFLSSSSNSQGPFEFSCDANGEAAYLNPCMNKKRRMLFTSAMNHDLYGDHRVFPQFAINSHDSPWIGSHEDLFHNNQAEKSIAYIEPTQGTMATPRLEDIKMNKLEISPLNNNTDFNNLNEEGWLYSTGGWLYEGHNNDTSFLAHGASHQNPFGHLEVSVSKEEEEEESHTKACSTKLVLGKKTLVYPFALLKPCEIQGDKTLKDINQKIHQTQSRGGGGDKPLVIIRPNRAKCIVGEKIRSVVARTTIYTQGQGTITVVRTKGG